MKVKTRLGQRVMAWILAASMIVPMLSFGMTAKAATTDYDAMSMSSIMSSKNSLTWVFTGDSITHNSLFLSGMNSYVEWFEKYLSCMSNRKNDSVINTAIGGSSVHEFVSDCTYEGKGTYNYVTKYNPDVIVFKIGMNNRNSDTNNYTPMTSKEFQTAYQEVLDDMYAECLAKHGKVPKIILLSSTPRRHEVSTAADCCTDCTVDRRNDVQTIAKKNGLLFCDLRTPFIEKYNELANLSKYQNTYFNDVTHPNGAGQYLIFKNFCETLGVYDANLPIFQIENDDMNKAPLYVDATKDVLYSKDSYFDNLNAEMDRDMPDAANLKLPKLLASIDFNSTDKSGVFEGKSTFATSRHVSLTNTTLCKDTLTLSEAKSIGKEFSVVFRAKVDSPNASYQTVLFLSPNGKSADANGAATSKSKALVVGIPGNNDWFALGSDNASNFSPARDSIVLQKNGTNAIKDGKWHTIAIVQSEQGYTCYLDGEVYYTYDTVLVNDIGSYFTASDASLLAYVGCNDSSTGDTGKTFDGSMDYYQLYKGALSASQVKTLYDKGGVFSDEMGADMPTITPSAASSLVSIDFDSTNGEISGTNSYSTTEKIDLTNKDICYNNDALTVTDMKSMGREYSIVLRAKVDAPQGSYQTAFYATTSDTVGARGNDLVVGIPGTKNWLYDALNNMADGNHDMSHTSASCVFKYEDSPNVIADGAWHTIAIVQTKTAFKYYVDGDLVHSKDVYLVNDIGTVFANAKDIVAHFGANISDSIDKDKNFDGFVDYYQFYKGALTATEVKNLTNKSGHNQMDAPMPTISLPQIPSPLASVDFNSTNKSGVFQGKSTFATSKHVSLTDSTVCENTLTLSEAQSIGKEFSIVFRAKVDDPQASYQTVLFLSPNGNNADADGAAKSKSKALVVGIPGTKDWFALGSDNANNFSPARDSIVLQRNKTNVINDGQWHTFAIVQSSKGYTFYMDGTVIYEYDTVLVNDIGSYFTGTNASVLAYIGCNDSSTGDTGKTFDGTMDYYQLYKGALSASQVNALFKANSTEVGGNGWANLAKKDNLWVFAGSEQMMGYEGFPVERSLYRLFDNSLRRGYAHNHMVEAAGQGYTVQKLNSQYSTLIGKHNYQVFMLLPNMEEVFAEGYVHSTDKVASFKTAVQNLLSKSSGKQQVLWTPLASTDSTINGYLADYAKAIVEIAKSKNVYVFNAYKFMTENMRRNASLKRNWFYNKEDITPLCATDLTHSFMKVFAPLSANTQIETTDHDLRFSSDVRPSKIKGTIQRDNYAVNSITVQGETIIVDLTNIKQAYNLTSVTFKVMPWLNAGSYHKETTSIAKSAVTVSGNKYSFRSPSTTPVIAVYGTTSTGTYRFGEFELYVPKVDNRFTGTTLNLDGTISFNFYINKYSTLGDQAYAEFVLPRDGKQVVKKADTETTSNGIKFTCQVPAKEMADTVTATLYDENGAVVDKKTLSVKQYAETVITNTSNNTAYEAATPLLKSMLHYGAYAQKYFGYNIGTLANKTYASEDAVAEVTEAKLSGFGKGTQKKDGFGSLAGASLVLESETTLRMFFQFEPDVDLSGLKFTSGGANKSYMQSGNYYVVDFENIAACDLDKDYTVTVSAGNNTFNATCSAMTFCYNVLLNSSDKDLQNLAKAMYLYNIEANKYFE